MNPFNSMTKSEMYFYNTKMSKPAYDFSLANSKEAAHEVARMISKLARQFLPVADAEAQAKLAIENAKARILEAGLK